MKVILYGNKVSVHIDKEMLKLINMCYKSSLPKDVYIEYLLRLEGIDETNFQEISNLDEFVEKAIYTDLYMMVDIYEHLDEIEQLARWNKEEEKGLREN